MEKKGAWISRGLHVGPAEMGMLQLAEYNIATFIGLYGEDRALGAEMWQGKQIFDALLLQIRGVAPRCILEVVSG